MLILAWSPPAAGVVKRASPVADRDSDQVDYEASVGQLIVAARAGDVDAFAALYAGHVHRVRSYARRLAAHEQAADDLVAEAFARTWEQLRAGQGPTTAFMGYVRAAVLNLHLSHLRREQRLDWVEDIEDAAMANPELAARITEQSPEHLVIEQLFNDRMKEALATLPQRWQQVIVLVYIEDRPYPEIAEQLNLSVAATRQLARRARTGMRNALAARSDDEWAVA